MKQKNLIKLQKVDKIYNLDYPLNQQMLCICCFSGTALGIEDSNINEAGSQVSKELYFS